MSASTTGGERVEGMLTTAEGKVSIGAPMGTYTVKVTKPGYRPWEKGGRRDQDRPDDRHRDRAARQRELLCRDPGQVSLPGGLDRHKPAV